MTDTQYNYSAECKKCGELINPVERLFVVDNSTCPTCKNEAFTKKLKGAMA